MAVVVQRRMRRFGFRPSTERVRAPTSPTWVPLLRALLRVWAAAFLAAAWHEVALGLGVAAIVGGFPFVAGLIRFVPLLGARSINVVASRRGRKRGLRPLVVVAHLDTHATDGAPLRRPHALAASISAWLIVIAALALQPGTAWRTVAAIVAAESVVTLARLARQELTTPAEPPDDNTSGLLALVRLAELVDGTQLRDMWLVATGAGTSGSYGASTFLRRRRDLRSAWLVEIDALGVGEMVASPLAARFPRPGTPPALIRAIGAAARASGDPLTVRRVRRPHSDARAALRSRTAAITLTGGLRPPAGDNDVPDDANAERAARVVDQLSRMEV